VFPTTEEIRASYPTSSKSQVENLRAFTAEEQRQVLALVADLAA
jgi:hypothetical protein